jgi:isopenicillin N synthase-like dioxygenase
VARTLPSSHTRWPWDNGQAIAGDQRDRAGLRLTPAKAATPLRPSGRVWLLVFVCSQVYDAVEPMKAASPEPIFPVVRVLLASPCERKGSSMAGLRTFGLPDTVNGTDSGLAKAMVEAWQADGAFQLACDRWQARRIEDAFEVSRRFFAMPAALKSRCLSDLTYSGYLTSGAGEIFLICPDIPLDDARVQAQWPCHGPVPWPGIEYRRTMRSYLTELASIGEKVLRLIALALGSPDLDWLTDDGWHHLQVRRFPQGATQPRADYGMLVISAEESSNTLTVSPGEIMEFLTDGMLRPALYQAGEHAMVYFHEPDFDTGIRPFTERDDPQFVHYGTHFTSMFMHTYPCGITTRRIVAEDRLAVLAGLARRASVEA